MRRRLYSQEHADFRDAVRRFLEKEVAPHYPGWEAAHGVPRDLYRRMGELGFLGIQVPVAYGGGGADSFLFNTVLVEEAVRQHVVLGSSGLHMDVVVPYFLANTTPDQKQRWLPGIAAGDLMTAIAMTEPGTGSDLAGITTTARPDGDHYVVNGAKTFVTGGLQADLVVVVARTERAGDRRGGLSLLVVEAGTPGFSHGRNLDKLGLHASDTAELFLEDVRVPAANLLGAPGDGFGLLESHLPQERLSIAVVAQAMAAEAVALTVAYVQQRTAFGATIGSFQNTKFVLAECATQVAAGQALLDQALRDHDEGELSAADAAAVKLFCTEMQSQVLDRCLQLHGGYGYLREFPIARMWADARVMRIYGGTSEIMKLIVSRQLGL